MGIPLAKGQDWPPPSAGPGPKNPLSASGRTPSQARGEPPPPGGVSPGYGSQGTGLAGGREGPQGSGKVVPLALHPLEQGLNLLLRQDASQSGFSFDAWASWTMGPLAGPLAPPGFPLAYLEQQRLCQMLRLPRKEPSPRLRSRGSPRCYRVFPPDMPGCGWGQ